MTQEVGSQKCKGQIEMWTEHETWLHSDQRLGMRLIAEQLNMNKEIVQQIITEDLRMRKVSSKMVPQILTDGECRLHISSGLLHNAEMFDTVITGDEMWWFQYDPETKCQSMQWKTEFALAEKSMHISLAV
jgi:hypothetical protein